MKTIILAILSVSSLANAQYHEAENCGQDVCRIKEVKTPFFGYDYYVYSNNRSDEPDSVYHNKQEAKERIAELRALKICL